MKSDKEKLQELMERIGNPEAAPLTQEEQSWLEDFRERYPFFPLTADNPSQMCPPQGHARLDGVADASRHDNFYPPEKSTATPSTMAAIDDFLNTYGQRSSQEDALLERLIFNPVPDYAQQLAAEEQSRLPDLPAADADSRDARIDRFILSQKSQSQQPAAQQPAAQQAAAQQTAASHSAASYPADLPPALPSAPAKPAKPVKTEKPGLLSESLAKIYIKTRRYERAYEILNDLSLRFPEKSRYFADQLRFLRKLIQNEEHLRAENAGKTV